jgi:RHS repeat-associated protein
LLAETTGGSETNYIYAGGVPLAMLTGSTFTWLHDDNLGTPRVATNASQTVVWKASYLPYGETVSTTGSFVQNLRLPGQYFDAESGFSHNGFRDYVSVWGRYLEADPTGIYDNVGVLNSGMNPFKYVGGDPMRSADLQGLADDGGCGVTDGNPTHNWWYDHCKKFNTGFNAFFNGYGPLQGWGFTNVAFYSTLWLNSLEGVAILGEWEAGKASAAELARLAAEEGAEGLAATEAVTGVGEAAAVTERSAEEIIAETAQGHADSGFEGLKASMSENQIAAYNRNPVGGSRFMGTAVHDATFKSVATEFPGRFTYNRVGPDFFDTWTGQYIELTTPGQVASHIARGGAYTTARYATYVFPKP